MATEAKAILRYVRVTPRKLRLVVDLIRGKAVGEAFSLLKYTPRSAARVIEKVLKSAVANAEDLEVGDADELMIQRAFIDGGPTLKRFRARSMGRANPIKKRTSHVTIFVAAQPAKRRSVAAAKAAAAAAPKPAAGTAPEKSAAPPKPAPKARTKKAAAKAEPADAERG
jgi:large subunit ribosomal protein L22